MDNRSFRTVDTWVHHIQGMPMAAKISYLNNTEQYVLTDEMFSNHMSALHDFNALALEFSEELWDECLDTFFHHDNALKRAADKSDDISTASFAVCFWEWLFADTHIRTSKGDIKCLGERLILDQEDKARELDIIEEDTFAYLKSLVRSKVEVFDVLDVKENHTLTVRNIIRDTDTVMEVYTGPPGAFIKKGDVVGLRLRNINDRWHSGYGIYYLDETGALYVNTVVKDVYAKAAASNESEESLSALVFEGLQRAWLLTLFPDALRQNSAGHHKKSHRKKRRRR